MDRQYNYPGSVARILLADTNLASRLTLSALLWEAGYAVDSAATESEAIGKLDSAEYQLVLADLRRESGEAGRRLLSYARQKHFRPATALIASEFTAGKNEGREGFSPDTAIRISEENVLQLFSNIAGLIGKRADRRIRQCTGKPPGSRVAGVSGVELLKNCCAARRL